MQKIKRQAITNNTNGHKSAADTAPLAPDLAAAAIRAGYPERSARSVGSENLAKPDIREAVAEAQARRSKLVEVDQNYVVMRLKEEAERPREETSPPTRVRALELLGRHLGMFSDQEKAPPETPTKINDTITNPALVQMFEEICGRRPF